MTPELPLPRDLSPPRSTTIRGTRLDPGAHPRHDRAPTRAQARPPTHARPRSALSLRGFSASILLGMLAAATVSCSPSGADAGGRDGGVALTPLPDDTVPRAERMMGLLAGLAADSMEGRRAGTEGERRARDLLVRELERYGVAPAGDDGYLQRVPLVRAQTPEGRRRWTLVSDDLDPDTFPAEDRMEAWNVLGVIPGTDPELSDEVVIVGAHYDHLGIGQPVDGDSIYNGADDDGTGTVAVLEIARALVREGPAPHRSVLVALFSAEEMGLLGPRWFLEHPTVPVEQIVADLQIEMIGRPDSLAGGHGGGWLTGFERSTMGDLLREQGSPVVPDPRPEMNFFFRSDNLPFAMAGIPAHTLSSYDLHEDYHTPDDEVDGVEADHMATLTTAALEMVRGLASGERPRWHEGGRPEPGGR